MDQPLAHNSPAVSLPRLASPPPAYFFAKRASDIVLAALGLLLCAPLLLIAALLVRLESPGPALFRRRVLSRQTWDGTGKLHTFDAFKLRTMVDGAETLLAQDPALMEQYAREWKLPADPRITRLGVWLRATSIDELPQLVNVLKGDMTLVGPRMITPPELERYGEGAVLLLSVKPGLTGLWQVSGRQKLPYAERVRLDLRYIQSRSAAQDAAILLRTVGCVLGRRGGVLTPRSGVLTARLRALPPRFLPALLLWAVVISGLTGYAFRRSSAFLLDADAMDTAHLARQIATGHGFSTLILRPLAITGWTPPTGVGAGVSASDISHAPLFPLILAVALAAHGGHGAANLVVAVALVGFLLSILSVAHLARTLLPGEHWPVLLACGLYALGTGVLGDAARGGPSGWTAWAVCELVIALLRTGGKSGRRVFVAGAWLGACYLFQYSLLLMLPLALVFVYARRAWVGVGLCSAGFLLMTGAWLVRTAMVTHSGPFFDLRLYGLLAQTPDFPGATSVFRGLPPDAGLLAFFFSHPEDMVQKAARGLSAYAGRLPDVANVFLLAPALASVLTRPPNPKTATARVFTLLAVLLLTLVTAFFAPSVGTLLPLAAPVSVLAAGWVWHTVKEQNWPALGQRVGLWAWAVLAGASVFTLLVSLPPDKSDPLAAGIGLLLQPPLPAPADAHSAEAVAGGAILTDAPWAVAWRTGLPAVWLPQGNAAYEAVISGRGAGMVNAPSLLLTPAVNTYSADDLSGWDALALHPQARTVREQKLAAADRIPAQFEQKVADVRRLAQSGRITLSAGEIDRQEADARALLPAAVQRQKAQVQADFDADYGPVSEAVDDYAPVGSLPEGNRQPSTLFLRRELLPALGVTVQTDAE